MHFCFVFWESTKSTSPILLMNSHDIEWKARYLFTKKLHQQFMLVAMHTASEEFRVEFTLVMKNSSSERFLKVKCWNPEIHCSPLYRTIHDIVRRSNSIASFYFWTHCCHVLPLANPHPTGILGLRIANHPLAQTGDSRLDDSNIRQ